MFSFIERVMTAANARCSYMGCTRRRHVGPCNADSHEHVRVAPRAAAPIAVAPSAVVVAPIPLDTATTRETLAPARVRSNRPSRTPGSMAPPPC